MKEAPKPKFRSYLQESVQKRTGKPLSELNNVQQSKEMTRFYVTELIRATAPALMPDDEDDVLDCVVDGPNDCGVDFISRVDGRVLIVQSKYHGPDKYERVEDFGHFCEVIKRLHHSQASRAKINRKLEEALADVDWESDNFQLHFITLGRVGDQIKRRQEEGPSPISGAKDFEERVDLQLVDEVELNKRLREALSAGESIEEEVPIPFAPSGGEMPWIRFESETGRPLYVGQVSGTQLAEMYRSHKYRLFAMNIRDYVGETSTNKGIMATALGDPDDLLFFNNGISAVATAIREDVPTRTLYCSRFSIINGAQTVRSISKAHAKDREHVLRNARVMLRVCEFSLGKEHDFLANITRYNNTQNAIKLSDFRSNDPVQTDLAAKFSRLSRGGRLYWYKAKRSRETREGKIPIGMEELAKTVHAFRHGPDDVYGGTRFLFDIDEDGGYSRIFGEPVSRLSDEEFSLLAGTFFLCEEIRCYWKERREKEAEDGAANPALERRWMVFFAVGELLRMIYKQVGRDLDADLRRLAKPTWLDTDETTKKRVHELTKMACTALVKAYKRAASAEDFRHRNWFRTAATLAQVREELEVIPAYLKPEDLPRLH